MATSQRGRRRRRRPAQPVTVTATGLLSVRTREVGGLLNEAVICRLAEPEEDQVRRSLLLDVRPKLTKGSRALLRRSEFLVLMEDETLKHLDTLEQAYVQAVLQPQRIIHITL